MKFFIFGDEERFLLDRLQELNKNFDKETRIKFLRAEVKKRENIIHKRNKKHRCKDHKKLKIIKKNNICRHKRKKKLVSEIKIDSMEEKKINDVYFSDCIDEIDEEPSDDEVSEEENVKSEQLDTNFLQLISNELSYDQTESEGDDNDNKSDKKEPDVTIVKDDTLQMPDKKSVEEKQTQKGSVVGGLV